MEVMVVVVVALEPKARAHTEGLRFAAQPPAFLTAHRAPPTSRPFVALSLLHGACMACMHV
eukprot:1119712-Pelagomonas_calceolata.AAC.1